MDKPQRDALLRRFEDLLARARQSGASDIHLLAALPPMLRVTGEIRALADWPPTDRKTLEILSEILLRPEQQERLEREREICVSYYSERCGRHRLAFYHRLGAREMAIRVAQTEIPDRDALGLPPAVDEIILKTAGLALVTGPTGSGKTTTLNYMVDALNKSMNGKIVTIEDPVEFEHRHRRSIVTQIEVGVDTLAFSSFLRSVLRLDPDVIVIGEMRDMETISTALTGAETGHLVLGTLHTPSAAGTAERMINVFPGEKQEQIAMQAAATLLTVVSQRLIPTVDKTRRVLATEILVATGAVRHLIRERSFHRLQDAIQTGLRHGMHSLEASLASLYRAGAITRASAFAHANNAASLSALLGERPPAAEAEEAPDYDHS